jgi:acyl carrier protein
VTCTSVSVAWPAPPGPRSRRSRRPSTTRADLSGREPDELEPALRALVALHIDVHPDRLRPEASLGADLEIDSLTALELTMVLEDEFDVSLPEEVMADVCTYGDLLAVIGDRLKRRVPPPAQAPPS